MNLCNCSGIKQLVQGDSASWPLFLNAGTDLEPILYTLQEGDVVYFGIMEPNAAFEQSVVRKRYTQADLDPVTGSINIELQPEDTAALLPGLYYYQIKLTQPLERGQEKVTTVVPITPFYIVR